MLKWNQKTGYTEYPLEGKWRKPLSPSYTHFFPDNAPDSKSLCGLIRYANTHEWGGEIPNYAKCRSCDKKRQGIPGNARGDGRK